MLRIPGSSGTQRAHAPIEGLCQRTRPQAEAALVSRQASDGEFGGSHLCKQKSLRKRVVRYTMPACLLALFLASQACQSMCLLVSSNRVPARTHAGDATQYVPCRNLRREETSLHRATRTRTHARATCDPPSHPAQPVAARVWRLLRAAHLLSVSLATGPLFCTHPSRASVLVAASVPSQNRLISHGRHPAGLARITDSSLPVSPPACTGPASSASRGGKALTAPGGAVRIRHRSLRCRAQTSDGQERASMLLTAHDAVPARDT